MPRLTPMLLLACSGFAFAQPVAPKPADSDRLPIRGITLYRSGVGSFERRGMIDGDATVQFRFNTDQVNDILKSMIIMDLSKNGRIDGVSYGSRDPLAKRLSSFGVDISDEPSLGAILARLRGAKITMTMPEGPWSGTILGGEVRQEARVPDSQPVAVPYINILTASGIKSLNLNQALTVELLDKELAGELQRALTAVAEHRADRTKTVDISLSGQGSREIVVAYVQEAPVWKASYRLVLPDESAAAAKGKDQLTLQGWAIVENTTDEDWNAITLSLVSGRPVSFRMDLYQPLYVFRPEVPVPTVPGVAPRIFEGGVDDLAGLAVSFGEEPRKSAEKDAQGIGKPMSSMMRAGRPGSPGGGTGGVALKSAAPATTSADMAEYAARSQAKAVESGEIFEYQLDHPVTVERQRSAMLPIISSAVAGRRVSIFNAGEGGQHPMRGVEITNTSGLQLLPGPISVYDHGTYAGDAQIGHVPAGDKRLLAYSVDLAVTYQTKSSSREDIQKVRIVKGLLETTTLTRSTASYTFTNKDQARPRDIIIEYPKSDGWELKKPEKPDETTSSLYRFSLAVPAGKTGDFEIVQERTNSQTIGLLSIDLATLTAYSKGSGKVSDKVLDAYREAQRRQGLVEDAKKRIADLDKEKAGIDTDQARIRQNMATIERTTDLYGRYMKKLTDQEARLEAIAADLEKARAEQARLERELSEYVAGLNVD